MSNKPQIKIKGKIQDLAKKEKNIKPKHSMINGMMTQ